jgi:hypothetical protein
MATYRCYGFDTDDKIISVESTDLPNDAAAITWASARDRRDSAPSVAVEVWELGRMVIRLNR